jgi:hypothetical protein
MTYVYIANTASDRPFVERLSTDLKKADVPHWFDGGKATDEQVIAQLQKSSHLLVVLSPAVLTDERVLGALEGGKQFKLERIALRCAPMESLPPQIQGILPLNAVGDEAYATSLETLIHDLDLVPNEPDPELPERILTALYSDNVTLRRNAIQEMATYRNQPEALRELVLGELKAAIFRERDSSVKTLLRTTVQAFEIKTGELPDLALPSKEDLAQQAGGNAVIIQAEEVLYFWNSSRWHMIWAGVGLIVALIAFVIGGHWAYLIPTLLVTLILPQLNIVIRKKGEFDWEMPGPLIGNVIMAILFGSGSALVLMLAIGELDATYYVVNTVLGIVLGVAIGWLSSLETTSVSQ